MYNQQYHKFERLYNHKYGFHINGPNAAAYDAAIRLKPRVIKTLEHNVDAMKRLREAVPDAFMIGRLYDPVQDFGNNPAGDPMADRIGRARQRGVEFADKILRQEINRVSYQGRPIFNAWESFNEIFPESVDVDTQKLYDEFQVAFGQRLLAEGFEPIAFNFATGNFRGWHLVDNFPGTLETYKYLGFHEYDWPRLNRLHDLGLSAEASEKNLRDRLPGIGANIGNDGMWLCLRYRRMLHEGVRQKYGSRHTCIITECGMTQGVQQGHDVGPWYPENTLPRSYPDSAVPTPLDPEQYWQELLWYNSELMKDDYVMGACLFVTGAVAQWGSFEHVGEITGRLERFQVELGAGELPTELITGGSPVELPLIHPAVADRPEPAFTTAVELSPVEPAPAPIVEPVQVEEVTPAPDLTVPAQAVEPVQVEEVTPAPLQEVGTWSYTLTTGPGLPLLVGDIGLANELITITRPGGRQERLLGGSKPEFGPGGFELYANEPGTYRIEFKDQSFAIPLSGQFTRVTFKQVT